ncbi:MAG: hypothetical protein RSA27_08915, partial [Oscillospiraceae bacterium]
DYETNDWLKNEQEYTLDYSITEGSVKRAIVNLTTPIVSDRIRVKIKAANVTWGTIRIEELAAYGELTGNKITANIVPEATVTTDIEFVAGDVNVIKDGDFASEARSEKLPSIEAPKTVTYDFGEKYYNFSTMEVVGLFAKDAGIKAMDIEYKKLGEWTKLGETINFARPNGTGTTNMEIDEIPIGIVSNGIRIKIKEAYSGWGHFRFSDILLYGKAEVNAAPLQGTRLDTRNYTKIELFNQDIDKLNDGKYDNGPFILKAIGSEPNFTIDDTYNIDIYANGYEAKVQSIDFACDAGLLPNQAITKIAVVGYDYETNDWLKNEQEYTLDYSITEGSV